MNKKIKILLDADSIVSKLGCSDRHARRLIQAQDPRVFELVDADALKPEALKIVHSVLSAVDSILNQLWRVDYKKAEYKFPDNWPDIYEAVEAVMTAKNRALDVAGIYYGPDPDGKVTSIGGFPTCYERALSGMPVNDYFRNHVETWAAKYGHKIDPKIFFNDDDETPSEPIVSHVDSVSATIPANPNAEGAD